MEDGGEGGSHQEVVVGRERREREGGKIEERERGERRERETQEERTRRRERQEERREKEKRTTGGRVEREMGREKRWGEKKAFSFRSPGGATGRAHTHSYQKSLAAV